MRVLKKDIYIDIDGVILTRGVTPAEHLDYFLKYVLSRYSVSWLTSRCQGDSKNTVRYLSQFLSTEGLNLIKKIKPTTFRLDKTEAIDFSRKFFWLDDELFVSEEKILKKHDKYDSWIRVDLIENPNQLLQLVKTKLN